jgi:hypothetical protein
MSLTLESDDLSVLKSWVYASFAVPHDARSHTRAFTKLGQGAVIGRSSKHKLHTRSSMEAEFVDEYAALPQVLWTRHFLESQGYRVQESVV